MKPTERRIQLTDRDIDLMRWILEQKFMTEKQIRRIFWKGVSQKSSEANKRLEMLRRGGFLKTNKALMYKSFMYLVAGKGIEELKKLNRNSGLGELSEAGYSTYKHDLAVTDLRILFNDMGYKDWLSERVLSRRGGFRRTPDGMIFSRERYTAIEYEASLKSKRRYRDIFFQYELDREIAQVLYIVNTAELVQKVSRESVGSSKIYFVTLDDIQRDLLNTGLRGPLGYMTLQEIL
jgi:hypothetical protein